MNKELILAEWGRALDSQQAAELLAMEKYHADAVSRTYYAVLHAAKAALHAEGVVAESHPAVRRMFGLHLINAGKIEKDFAVHLAESFDDRFSADYDPQTTFSSKETRQLCRQTRKFLARIRNFLRSKGFKSSELRRKKQP